VVYGHVGNSAAVFMLQRLGVEVWPIHTVQFSNHTGYETWRGRAFEAGHIRELVQGLGERDALEKCDGVLSGYIGSAAIGEAILDAVAQVKQANPEAVYCCDPVIGDIGRGAFVPPEVAEFMRRHAAAAADIVTPNHFELEQLAGREVRTLDDARAAIEELRGRGPRVVVVTSLATEDTPVDAVDVVACNASGCYRLRTPKLRVAAHGAGDAFAALFLAHHLRTRSLAEALSCAASSLFGVLQKTMTLNRQKMALVEAQDELIDPSTIFHAEPV
jgi:pyridoxine kinase